MKKTLSLLVVLIFVFLLVPVSFASAQSTDKGITILRAPVCDECHQGVIITFSGAWGPWETYAEVRCVKFPNSPFPDLKQGRLRIIQLKCNYCGYIVSWDTEEQTRTLCTHV